MLGVGLIYSWEQYTSTEEFNDQPLVVKVEKIDLNSKTVAIQLPIASSKFTSHEDSKNAITPLPAGLESFGAPGC